MKKICAIGELLVDFTSKPSSTKDRQYTAHPGGAPANFLAACSFMGAQTHLIASVGEDFFGDMLIEALAKHSIHTEAVRRAKEAFTTLAFVKILEDGDREFAFARKPGADIYLHFGSMEKKILLDSQAIHFGGVSLIQENSRKIVEETLSFAQNNEKIISYDPNVRLGLWESNESCKEISNNFFRYTDIAKVSDEEFNFLFADLAPSFEERIHQFFQIYPTKILFITEGSNGAHFATRQFHGHVDCPQKINTIDTTGAGDIFTGIALSQLLNTSSNLDAIKKEEVEKICQLACNIASYSTEYPGGMDSLNELKNKLKYRKKTPL